MPHNLAPSGSRRQPSPHRPVTVIVIVIVIVIERACPESATMK
ncbi:hypothetical protein WB401_21375 [Streptomyces brasiliscabiei]|uniref:Transposase n=1 Tax=Streptomyces brasiliscabiei TaxID=2736302 RepID=A0ABU8GA12_9ACTN